MDDRRAPATGSGDRGRAVARRQALRFLGGVVGAATGMTAGGLVALATGCGAGTDGEGGDGAAARRLEVAVDDLPEGERVMVTVGSHVIELLRRGDEVTARSLICTHFGCTVAWSPEREQYVCPCHDGVYAPDGRVVSGPPSRPLPTLPVERRGTAVVVRAPGGEVAP